MLEKQLAELQKPKAASSPARKSTPTARKKPPS
jgi:hypothetical protein